MGASQTCVPKASNNSGTPRLRDIAMMGKWRCNDLDCEEGKGGLRCWLSVPGT